MKISNSLNAFVGKLAITLWIVDINVKKYATSSELQMKLQMATLSVVRSVNEAILAVTLVSVNVTNVGVSCSPVLQ